MRTSKTAILAIIMAINLQFVALFVAQPTYAMGMSASNFCAKITQESMGRMGKMHDYRYKGKDMKVLVNKDTKLAQLRSEADTKRSAHFDELAKKYTTESQKQALETYRTTILAAVQARRNAVDAIRQDFRTKLAQISNEHQNSLKDAENELLASVESAIATASDGCKSGADVSSIKAQFEQSILAAKTKFIEAKNNLSVNDSTVSALVAERDSALNQAYANFKATAEQARATLQAQLNSN